MVTPRQRPVIDIVVVMLSATVGIVMVLSIIGILIIRIMKPEADISRGAEAIGGLTTTLVGALVGFIGGRATGKWEESRSNGNNRVETTRHRRTQTSERED